MTKRGKIPDVSAIALEAAKFSPSETHDFKLHDLLLPNNTKNIDPSGVFLTEHELAARQKRSVKTLRNQRVLGIGCAFVKLGNSVRYRLSDVIEDERKNTRYSTTESKS